jgi:hypothetical protein
VFGISKKTVLQLVKEFWAPFFVSSAWTIYVALGPKVEVKDVISNFGSSFFLASWMTGQVFRVRKQVGMEASLEHLQIRLGRMIDELNDKALWTINHITGGDSYCHAQPVIPAFSSLPIEWEVQNCGSFPMYEVMVRITDLDFKAKSSYFFFPGTTEFETSLGEIPCDSTRSFTWGLLGREASRSFTITFDSRNGRVIQDVRFKRINGEIELAYRITRYGEVLNVLEEDIPMSFRDEHGEFDWSEPVFNENDGSSYQSYRS